MTHKVHPVGYRLGISSAWRSRWMTSKNLAQYLREDFLIREFLSQKLDRASTDPIEIERTQSHTMVVIRTSRPGLLIGRGGGGIEKLKQDVVSFLSRKLKGKLLSKNIKLTVEEIRTPELQAKLVAEGLAVELEKRVSFRRAMKSALERVSAHKQVQGVKIALSGRLDGREMARDEWLKKGRVPLQTLRAHVDYGEAVAYTVQGTIGVKVWIYKGDVFESAKAKS